MASSDCQTRYLLCQEAPYLSYSQDTPPGQMSWWWSERQQWWSKCQLWNTWKCPWLTYLPKEWKTVMRRVWSWHSPIFWILSTHYPWKSNCLWCRLSLPIARSPVISTLELGSHLVTLSRWCKLCACQTGSMGTPLCDEMLPSKWLVFSYRKYIKTNLSTTDNQINNISFLCGESLRLPIGR